MRFFISLSYNGAAFCGWQRQINGPSVQEHLENAFSVYLREKIEITGAGRTDTGVHATNYIAHSDSGNTTLIEEQQLLLYKINAILPASIVVTDICAVSPDAHARFDALSRTYNYYVHTIKEPFLTDFSYFFPSIPANPVFNQFSVNWMNCYNFNFIRTNFIICNCHPPDLTGIVSPFYSHIMIGLIIKIVFDRGFNYCLG